MKLLHYTVIAVSALAALTLCAASPARLGDPDWFPIMAWGTNQHLRPANEPLTVERFREMAEAGITVAGFALDREELDMIHEAGLVAYYQDWSITSQNWPQADPSTFPALVQSCVERVNDHPAVYGYMVGDEPTAAAFPNQSAMFRQLRQAAPGKDLYMNLYPNYAGNVVGTPTYREYMEKFVSMYQPDWFSYDFYGLLEGGVGIERPGFWNNLDDARNVSQATGVPFHICTQSVAHFDFRAPSLTDLYYEVYSGLLYGAQGIHYFTYFSPDCGNYRGAPINGNGDRTETYHAMREVNATVRCLAPTLKQLKSTAVYHLPAGAAGSGENGPAPDSLIAAIPSWGTPMSAVGEFTHQETGDTYVMILNKNPIKSLALDQIKWRTPPAKLQVVSQTRPNVLREFAGEEVWIAPGRAVLLKVTK